jgi:membrane-bound lytic murein transglycosylase D
VLFRSGQADRFRAGLQRAGAWEAHIAQTLAQQGLPAEIAALPHVESSFQPTALSKAGAAGLWQFIRSTGRRYLRIDRAVDERLDPDRSTEAAAQLLSYNYRLLGTWPLAITAYNHGAEGMRRAREQVGSDDIVQIVRHYRSPSFGFASRNYYASFLAALRLDRDPERYFGTLRRESAAASQELPLDAPARADALAAVFKLSRDALRALNPALRATVWSLQQPVPRGYRLRLPPGLETWSGKALAARLAGAALCRAAHGQMTAHQALEVVSKLAEVATADGTSLDTVLSRLLVAAQPLLSASDLAALSAPYGDLSALSAPYRALSAALAKWLAADKVTRQAIDPAWIS